MATFKGSGVIREDATYDFSWAGFVTNADVGSSTTIPAHVRELAIQAFGTFAGSIAIQLQGSMDDVSYSQLKDMANAAISLTDNTVVRFSNPPKYIKPVVTAGSGGALLTVQIHGSID